MGGLLVKLGFFLTFMIIAALFIKVVILPYCFSNKKKQNTDEDKKS